MRLTQEEGVVVVGGRAVVPFVEDFVVVGGWVGRCRHV